MRLGRVFPAIAFLLLASSAAEAQTAREIYSKQTPNPEETLFLDCVNGFQIRTPQREACAALLETPDLIRPKRAGDYIRRSMVYSAIEEYDRAFEDGDEAVRRAPNNVAAYVARGAANWYLGRIAAAALDYDRALEIDPKAPDALFGRGLVYSAFNDDQKALEHFDEAIARKPEFVAAYFYRGSANARLGHHEAAIEDFGTAVRLDPADWRSLVSRGNNLSELGQYDAALADYEAAARSAPDAAAPHNSIAWLRTTAPDDSIRDGNEAVNAARRAAELEPAEPNILDTLAAS